MIKNWHVFCQIDVILEKTSNQKGNRSFLSFQYHFSNFAILLKLVIIWSAADSLASEGLEHILPSNEHWNSTPLTVTLALNPPSIETLVRFDFSD